LGKCRGAGCPSGLKSDVLDAFGGQRILGHAGLLLIDLQAVRILQDFDIFPPAARTQ